MFFSWKLPHVILKHHCCTTFSQLSLAVPKPHWQFNMKSLGLESSNEFVVWDSFMAIFLLAPHVTCWVYLRSANVRRPVPSVRCKSRHDLEIQGRFAGILGWSCYVLLMSWLELVERPWKKHFLSKFLHDFCSMVFQTFFSDGWRYLEALFSVLRSNIFGDLWSTWCCWLRVVMASPSGKLMDWVPRSEIRCFVALWWTLLSRLGC